MHTAGTLKNIVLQLLQIYITCIYIKNETFITTKQSSVVSMCLIPPSRRQTSYGNKEISVQFFVTSAV